MSTHSSPELLCPDWVFSNTSNVHACKNRGWFSDYTPFESFTGSARTNGSMPVLGVGTVNLPTKKAPGRSGRGNHGQLVLHDVLHVPSIFCNMIGMTEKDFSNLAIQFGGSSPLSSGNIKDKQGRLLAYFDASKPLFQVKLSGPPVGPVVGPSVFNDPDGAYYLNVRWAQSELARWEAHKQGSQVRTDRVTSGYAVARPSAQPKNPQPDLGYTQEEKAWLKKYYGGEWHFLRTNGLSIYNDDERKEGREIVRAFMEVDSSSDKAFVAAKMGEEVGDGSEDDDEESDEDTDGHMVDYLFDEQALRWIKKHYGTSMNFMYSYGLKFYDNDDCEEAQAVIRCLMQED